MNIYEARYNNAIKIMKRINSLLDEGYLILDEDGNRVTAKLVLNDAGDIIQPVGHNTNYIWFINDIDMDNGFHTSVAEYKDYVKNWKVVHPEHIQKLDI